MHYLLHTKLLCFQDDNEVLRSELTHCVIDQEHEGEVTPRNYQIKCFKLYHSIIITNRLSISLILLWLKFKSSKLGAKAFKIKRIHTESKLLLYLTRLESMLVRSL